MSRGAGRATVEKDLKRRERACVWQDKDSAFSGVSWLVDVHLAQARVGTSTEKLLS